MNFNQYYKNYLSLHQNLWCRRLHVVGQLTTISYIIFCILTSKFLLLLFSPFVVYPFAWTGHYLFEKNEPAAFKNPIFAKMSDAVMFKQWIFGEIKR
jgi:hypothetical protein